MDMYLAHHGIKGQKWGVRRYQNPDGTLTPEGKERYHKEIDHRYRLDRAATGAAGAYIGGIGGAVFLGAPLSLAFGPAGTAASIAGGAFLGSAGILALTHQSAKFDRDEQHMYIESGKYFMQENVSASLDIAGGNRNRSRY